MQIKTDASTDIKDTGTIMKRILCFGDSNTWGYPPDGLSRYDSDTRWPALLQQILGKEYRVIEEGHCGRTTVYDDPEVPGRNGLKVLPTILDAQAPLDLIIIMLGTNDLKNCYHADSTIIAENINKLITLINSRQLISKPAPEILVIAPPKLLKLPQTNFKTTFSDGIIKSLTLAETICDYFADSKVHTLNADNYISSSPADGMHLEPEAHRKLARIIAENLTASGFFQPD